MSKRGAMLLAISVTAFATLTTAVGISVEAPARFLVADAITGLTFVVSGLVAAWLRPGSPAGLLLLASGGLWFVGSYAPTGLPVLMHLGFAFEGYYDLTLAALLLMLSAPGRALRPLAWIAALAIAMGARSLGRLLLPDPAVHLPETGLPANPFAIHPDFALFETVEIVTSVAMTILFVGIACVAAARLLRSGPAARRSRWPVIVAGTLAMAGAAYRALGYAWSTATGTLLVDLPGPEGELLEWTIFALRTLVPVAFLVGVLRLRGRAGALAPLAVSLGAQGDPSSAAVAARHALGDPTLTLLVAREDGTWLTEAGAQGRKPKAGDGRAVTLVGRPDAPVGALVHDPALHEQPELLDGVVTVLRLALENERFQVELREQLQEVRASRARIVTATEEERRRLERDLHDGAQQRLVAVTLALQEARATAEAAGAPTELRTRLDVLGAELAEAIRELRELARGIHPAILENEGLRAAVAGLARRASLPVDVSVDLDGRLPDIVESTAYFMIAEALTNAQRHANASHATVRVTADEHALLVDVVDDGTGGADPRRGSGLRGLADRVFALGGDLRVDSHDGRGTSVHASIPIP